MPVLEVERVSWRSVLRDVSLEVAPGALVGVWGRRGAGKTTLAKLAAGRLIPDEGEIRFEGRTLSGSDRSGASPAQIGFAGRHETEFDDMTAAAWIASGLVGAGSWRTARRRAGAAMEHVSLGAAAALRWAELSALERTLAAIAQAIVRGPRLVVVDDPVAGLADEDRRQVLDLLRALTADGVAVLATAAEPAPLAGFDAVWALENGRLTGPPPRSGRVFPLRARGER